MIKTLHITNAYHASSGGIRAFYRALLESAERRGRHMRLVVPARRSSVEILGPCARIYHVKAPRSLLFDRRYRLILLILPHVLLNRRGSVWRILQDEQPDLIEVCDKYALCYLGGLIRRRWLPGQQRPTVVALTCERMDDNVATFVSGSALARWFSRWYIKRVYMPQFDGHIAVSRHASGELDGSLREVHVAPMWIDSAWFARERRSEEARIRIFGGIADDPRAVLLLYAGRLSREKNLPLLLDMIAALPASDTAVFHLCIAGDGPLREWILSEAQQRPPGRVHLLGHIEGREALATCYANADVLAHPNPREPFGLAPLEAMASGLPLVAPCSGGVLEYASHANAWLTEATGVAFAEAVQRLIASPSERNQKIGRARETAHAFDWRIVSNRYFELYDDIHERSAGGRPTTSGARRRKITGFGQCSSGSPPR